MRDSEGYHAGYVFLIAFAFERDRDLMRVIGWFSDGKKSLMPYMYKAGRLYGVVYELWLGRSWEIMLGEWGLEGESTWNLPKVWKVLGLIVYGGREGRWEESIGYLRGASIWKIKIVKILKNKL